MSSRERHASSACAIVSLVVSVGLLLFVAVCLTLNWQNITEEVSEWINFDTAAVGPADAG